MVEPHTFGNFDFTLNGKFLLHGDHTLPSNLSIAGEMRLPMWMSVLVEIVATCTISAVVAMLLVWEERNSRTQSMAVWEPRYPWVAVGSDILHTFRMEGTGEEGGGCCPSPATLFVFARRPEQGYNSENDTFAKKMTRHTKHPGSELVF